MTGQDAQRTACVLCECNCGITIAVRDRTLASIRGDKQHPTSQGYTCEKALRLDLYQNGPHRLTSPLKRRPDGGFTEIDWDTAITEITDRLGEIRARHGGDKIFFYGGGGQGNHLGAANAYAFRKALGSRYHSNALAQEKTGEVWVDAQLYGGHTKGDFEHAEVVLFLGKNPWQSHSFPRARPVLRQIAADPNRTMIVVDPRVSDTAAMADIHLQVKPGCDAWLMAGLVATLVQEDLVDTQFLAEHSHGYPEVRDTFATIDIAACAATCGVDEQLIRGTAGRIAAARSFASYEDLGIQHAPHSTLVSYLHKLLWILTGNFGRPGTMYLHSSLSPLVNEPPPVPAVIPRRRRPAADAVAKAGTRLTGVVGAALAAAVRSPRLRRPVEAAAGRVLAALAPLAARAIRAQLLDGGAQRRTPVTRARIIGGLVPCNSIADEILTDHPDRFRALWIDSANPAHSLADSARFREAMAAVDLAVVVDVALTETARHADYVLPAASQYEKTEATFFNFEFPRNVFHLRRPLLPETPGTLAEPEIYARLLRRMNIVEQTVLDRLRTAAHAGRNTYAITLLTTIAARPDLADLAPFLLHETLGDTLPPRMRGAAVLWALSQLCALTYPTAVARAGYHGRGFIPGNALFDAILADGTAIVFTEHLWDEVWQLVRRADRRFTIAVPDLLPQVAGLQQTRSRWTSDDYPLVLSAGERRAFTANTIIRNPDWRRRDRHGSLRISPQDAEHLGLADGDSAQLSTPTGSTRVTIEVSTTMQAGHIALPNGMGVDFTTPGDTTGTAPNDLTSTTWKDAFAGTPWHKHIPARLEPIRS
nr:molybdopterin-dependent oxidoreductase [Micromonospora sp. DSM 115978]